MYTVDELCSLPGNSVEEIPDADFAADDNVAILAEKPIVITNPPWSLFRKFFSLITGHGADMLIVGNINAVSYKDVFYSIKDETLKVSTNRCTMFATEDEFKKIGLGSWFTTFEETQRPELILKETYSSEKHPKLANYDAILVNRTENIPYDYEGTIAVPFSYMQKHNRKQFEIVGITKTFDKKYTRSFIFFKQVGGVKNNYPFNKYSDPVLIKDKPPESGVYYTNGKDYLKVKMGRLLIRRRAGR